MLNGNGGSGICEEFRYPEMMKFRKISSVGNLQTANFGTGMGYYDFCYDNLNISAFNFALTTQSLYFDYQLMKCYKSKFTEGCWMLLVLPYCIFCANDLMDFRGLNERYYSILPPEAVEPYCDKSYQSYLKELGEYEACKMTENSRKLEMTEPLNEHQMEVQSDDAIKNWIRQLGIVSFQSGEFSERIKMEIQESRKCLLKIFDFCTENGFRPVIVIPPLSETLLARISADWRRTHFYEVLENARKGRNIPVLDYTRERKFCNPLLFGWPGFLIKSAAKEFTTDVLQKVGILHS